MITKERSQLIQNSSLDVSLLAKNCFSSVFILGIFCCCLPVDKFFFEFPFGFLNHVCQHLKLEI
jgi:hypothetical protein